LGYDYVHTAYVHANAKNYVISREFAAAAVATVGARHKTIKPHCPWQNGKVERFNRTMQAEWPYHEVFTDNTARTTALTSWLEYYNTQRGHTALDGHPPISRTQSPT
jgi:transposase InsO family protein